ncbi:uncharacterized [Tachysurus ichikawai]
MHLFLAFCADPSPSARCENGSCVPPRPGSALHTSGQDTFQWRGMEGGMLQDHANPLNEERQHTCQENIRPGGKQLVPGM